MRYFAVGVSDNGDVRDNNEDAFLINNTIVTDGFYEEIIGRPFFVAVCDGVGGEKCGEVASEMTLQKLSTLELKENFDIKKSVLDIHKAVKKKGLSHSDFTNMQTTLCGIYVDNEGYGYCVNVGDSRLYKYVDGRLSQISTDHSLVEYLYSIGQITDTQKTTHNNKHIIMPVIGNNDFEPSIDILPLGKIVKGELFLLCTDGMSDYLSSEEIEIGLSLNLSLRERIETLIELSIERGSSDNITAVVLKA